MRKNLIGIFILLIFYSHTGQASESTIELKIPASLSVNTDSLNNFPKPEKLTSLQQLKRSQLRRLWFDCRTQAVKLFSSEKQFRHWVWNIYWNCTSENAFSTQFTLKTVYKRLQSFPFHPNTAAYNFQRHNVYSVIEKIFEQDRFIKSTYSDKILQWFEKNELNFTVAQRAEIYSDYAHLLVKRSQNDKAIEYLKKSIQYLDTPKAVKKMVELKQIEFLKSQKIRFAQYLEDSEVVNKEHRQFLSLWKSGSWKKALTALARIPFNEDSEELYDKVRRDLPSLMNRLSASQRRVFFAACAKLSGKVLHDWAERLFWRYHYSDSFKMAKLADSKLNTSELKGENYYLMGMVRYFYSEYEEAKSFLKLAETEFNIEHRMQPWTLFRLGLLEMRLKDWNAATNYFDRILRHSSYSDFHLSAYYWKFVSLEKLGKNDDAKEVANKLIHEYPITYFGLRLQNELKIKPNFHLKNPQSLTLEVKNEQKVAWRNFQKLLKLSLIEEAAEELAFLEFSEDPVEQLFFSYYLAKAHKYYDAFERIGEIWDMKIGLNKEVVLTMYPRAFKNNVTKYAKKFKVDPELVWGIIRQESAFRRKVVSPSNAIGLMQLIPSTARENARNLGYRKIDIPDDLYQPWKNIKIGTYYFSRLLKRFRGSESLAAASYNVGIGNIRRWFSLRCSDCVDGVRELAAIDKLKQNVDRLEDLWVEELPWQETRYYVKAVLRNKEMYKSLYGDKSK